MSNTYFKQFDPLFETAGLIFACRNADKIQNETVKALNEMGLNGEEFYSSSMPVYDEYVQTFKSQYQQGVSDALFFDGIETGLLLLLFSLLVENKNLIHAMDTLKDSDINAEIIDSICEMYQMKSDKHLSSDYISFIDSCPFSDNEKWKLLQIMNSPKSRFQQLVDSIEANKPAFDAAQRKISAALKKLMDQYAVVVKEEKAELFGKIKKLLSNKADVYPTLAFPISQMVFSNSCYYGLLSSLITSQDESDHNTMLRCLKALGDASRLEILRLIKKKPMYNLEIAEQLGLTAATMSHHMSVLLTCGFVGVTKQESKVYYHLESEALRRFVKSLDKAFV